MSDKKQLINNEYTEDNIKHLGPIEAIRLRPAMYLGSLGSAGLLKCVIEIIQNAVDEYTVGYCKNIYVHINNQDKTITVEDDARGIPLGSVNTVFTQTHAGGKFDKKSYAISSGMNGVGSTVINAFADNLKVIVKRDGKEGVWEYQRGILLNKNSVEDKTNIKDLPEDRLYDHGTTVIWRPDLDAIQVEEFDVKKVIYFLKNLAFPARGLTITFKEDNKKPLVFYADPNIGIDDYFADNLKERKISSFFKPIAMSSEKYDEKNQLMFAVDVAMSYSFDVEGSVNGVLSFVNNLPTPSHGTHVEALKTASSSAITQIVKNDKSLIPKQYEKYNISGSDVAELLTAIVFVKHYDPMFDQQTKDKLNSADIKPFIQSLCYEKILNFLTNNRKEASKLVEIAAKKAKLRETAKKAKENIMKDFGNNVLSSSIDTSKYTPATKILSEPEKCELFIVEGSSAKGGFQYLNVDYQGLFSLKGKMLNFILNPNNLKSSSPNVEALSLVNILNIQRDKDGNLIVEKLRYHKIIIATDADDDGYHIQVLISAFIHKEAPELIELGMVYFARPPLFSIETKANKIDLIDKKSEIDIYKMIFIDSFEIFRYEDEKTPLSNNFIKYLTDVLFGVYKDKQDKIRFYKNNYIEMVDDFSKVLSIDSNLLEMIIVNYKDLKNGIVSKIFKGYNFNVKLMSKDNYGTVYEIDEDYNHYYINLNSQFYNDIYIPFMTRFKLFGFTNCFLKSKKTGDEYTYFNTYYYLFDIILKTLKNNGVKITRFKGLGEMPITHVASAITDPETRELIKMTQFDIKETERVFEIMLGKNPEFTDIKKQMFIDDV